MKFFFMTYDITFSTHYKRIWFCRVMHNKRKLSIRISRFVRNVNFLHRACTLLGKIMEWLPLLYRWIYKFAAKFLVFHPCWVFRNRRENRNVIHTQCAKTEFRNFRSKVTQWALHELRFCYEHQVNAKQILYWIH